MCIRHGGNRLARAGLKSEEYGSKNVHLLDKPVKVGECLLSVLDCDSMLV